MCTSLKFDPDLLIRQLFLSFGYVMSMAYNIKSVPYFLWPSCVNTYGFMMANKMFMLADMFVFYLQASQLFERQGNNYQNDRSGSNFNKVRKVVPKTVK